MAEVPRRRSRMLQCFERQQNNNGLDQFDPGALASEPIDDLTRKLELIVQALVKKPLPAHADQAKKVIGDASKQLQAYIRDDETAVAPLRENAPVATPEAAGAQHKPQESETLGEGSRKLQKVVHAMQAQAALSLQPGSLAPAVNELVKILWPRIDKYVENMVRTSVESSVNDSLPGLVQKAGGVKFQTVSLGNTSPLFGPIFVEHKKENGAIEMHIGVNVDCDCDIELKAMQIPIGVTGFSLKGDLVVLMAPPMAKPPFFGGLQIYFPNPPTIAIRFAGAARVADVPGLAGAIRGAIDSAIAGICVLPRRIATDMDDEDNVDSVDLAYPEPVGILRFTLWSASNIVAGDAATFFSKASSDPYLVASLGIKSWTSPTIKKSLDPVWGDGKGVSTDFAVHDDCQTLSLKLYDYDFGTSDDIIGNAGCLETRSLWQDGQPQSVPMYKDDGTTSAGTLKISATYLSLTTKRPQTPPSGDISEAHLSAKILAVRGLELGVAYPFTVRVQLVSASEKLGVLVEGSTQASHPQEPKQLAEAYQEIAQHLSDRDTSPKDIADILEVGEDEVTSFLAKGKDSSKDGKASLESLNVKKPRFDEVVQLLLPCTSVVENNFVLLTILDKKKKALTSARIPVSQVLKSPDLHLAGPFATDSKDVEVVGSLRLKWLDHHRH